MSTQPGPAGPNAPPKSGMSPLVKILLGLLAGGVALLLIVAVAGYYLVCRNVRVSESPTGKSVEIESPIGSLRVNKEPPETTLAGLGIPVYPGATPSKEAAQLSFDFGEEGAKLTVVKLETPDSLDKVDAFYRRELGNRFKREAGKMIGDVHDRGHFVVKSKEGIVYSEEKDAKNTFVALGREGGGTKIAVVKVVERQAQ